MQPVIRSALVSDIPAMYSISRRAHQDSYASLIPVTHRVAFRRRYTYSTKALEEYKTKMIANITSRLWHVWVAEMADKVVGYTLGEQISDLLIQKRGLFVDPDYYGRGIGSALFERSLRDVPRGCIIRLSVIENNERAKRLYIKRGFVKVASAGTTFFGAKLDVMERTMN